MKHLLGVEDLSREEMERILDQADSFAEVGRRDIKKVPTLRGRTIVNLFYGASTRTLSSFELAAKRLSADVVASSRRDRRSTRANRSRTRWRRSPATTGGDRNPLAARGDRGTGSALDGRLGDQRG